MNADEHGSPAGGAKRFRLSTLFLFTTFVALFTAMALWIHDLRSSIQHLERRLSLLESSDSVPLSNVGVPLDIDEAMLMDSNPAIPIDMPSIQRIR